jgi:hypothetical protein
MTDELEGIGGGVIEIIFWHFSGGAEENHLPNPSLKRFEFRPIDRLWTIFIVFFVKTAV